MWNGAIGDDVMFTSGAPPISANEGDLHIWLIVPSQWRAVSALCRRRRPIAAPFRTCMCERRPSENILFGRTLLRVLRREYADGQTAPTLHGAVAVASDLLALAIGDVGRVSLTLATDSAQAAVNGWPIPGLPSGYRGSVRTACRTERLLVATLHADRPVMTVHYWGLPPVWGDAQRHGRCDIQ